MVDQSEYEPLTGRIATVRTVIRDGVTRRVRFTVRLLPFTELRDWLHAAGFTSLAGYGEGGAPLTLESRRMLAHR